MTGGEIFHSVQRIATALIGQQIFILMLAVIGKASALATGYSELTAPDEVLGFSNKILFIGIGTIEILIITLLLAPTKLPTKLLLTIWINGCFIAYRTVRFLFGLTFACSCVGNLSNAIPLSVRSLSIVLAFQAGVTFIAAIWIYILLKVGQRQVPNGRV